MHLQKKHSKICAKDVVLICETPSDSRFFGITTVSYQTKIQNLADKSYELLQQDPRYPSLHLKKVGQYWSVRVGIHYRAIAIAEGTDLAWFWIGSHAEYDQLLGRE